MKTIAVIGAGAAGCFCAIRIRRRHPDYRVTVLEAGSRPMAKLAVTGGGRCNITNTFGHIRDVREAYPRGHSLLRRLLKAFSPDDLLAWFGAEGIAFTVQEDGCVFPRSQDAMQIVGCLERLMRREGVGLRCNTRITGIAPLADGTFALRGKGGEEIFDAVVLCAGGSSSDFLRKLLPSDMEIVPTVPSLFTFRTGDEALKSLTGTVVDNARLSITGSGLSAEGILLVTDWGLSGPAALKLSSYAARYLYERQYRAPLCINWSGVSEEELRAELAMTGRANPKKLVSSAGLPRLSARLWKHLCARAGIPAEQRWAEIGKKNLNRLCATLCADSGEITGRARFKEEFVTCGGVALGEVSPASLESRKHPGLFFAGEVLDIDAVTGGFNLQAAWSTAYAVSESI